MRKLPETTLFSSTEPEGISMREPWLATMMTVPFNDTFLPIVTSPEIVRWSSSKRSGMPWKRSE